MILSLSEIRNIHVIHAYHPVFFPTRIITSSRASGWNNYYQRPEQKADLLHLERGEDYLLIAEYKEGGGYDYLQVSICCSVEQSL